MLPAVLTCMGEAASGCTPKKQKLHWWRKPHPRRVRGLGPAQFHFEGAGTRAGLPSTVLSLSPSICWMGMAVVTRGLEHLICLAQSPQEGSWEEEEETLKARPGPSAGNTGRRR